MTSAAVRVLLVLLVGAALCWSSIGVVGSDRVASQGRDEEASVEITPTSLSPGIPVRVTARCHRPSMRADRIAMYLYRVTEAGGTPYALVDTVRPVGPTQTLEVDFVVPGDAVNGVYEADIACFLQDRLFAGAQTPFEVTGGRDPETVTTTLPTTSTSAVTTGPTTTSSPTTSTTRGSEPAPEGGATVLDPPSPPASPVPGRVDYTG